MRCPNLDQLPPPPPDKAGWPWTEASAQLPDTMPDSQPWPRISIVTPTYNRGQFLEEAIRSVLLQGYPNLEYIVIDGGSTDGTIEIIRKYEPWLTYWISEPDHGQAHAINKGLARSTGFIFNWVNSDDVLVPGALKEIAIGFDNSDAVAGGVINFAEDGEEILYFLSALTSYSLVNWKPDVVFVQPGLWFRRQYVAKCSGIDESFNYAFDWDMVIRYLHLFPNVKYIPSVLVRFRLHATSKTVAFQKRFGEEETLILRKLRAQNPSKRLRTICDRRLRRIEWSNILNHLMNDPAMPNWFRPLRIAFDSCSDPSIRWSRLTAGTIRLTALRAFRLRISSDTH